MSEYRERPNADSIPCPFITARYNNGDLVPDENGVVHDEAIEETLAGVGLGPKLRKRLATSVMKADDSPDTINIFKLRDSKIDHTGSTGIRDPAVDPSKLPDLLAFGDQETKRMYQKHLAAASRHFGRVDPGVKGTLAETVEFTAALEVFGRKDEDGERYLSFEDIEGLWLHGRYPEGWTPRELDSITMRGFLAQSVGTMIDRARDRVRDFLD